MIERHSKVIQGLDANKKLGSQCDDPPDNRTGLLENFNYPHETGYSHFLTASLDYSRGVR